MEMFRKLALPKALKNSSNAKIEYQMGEFGEYETQFQNVESLLLQMPKMSIHQMAESDDNRARMM
ncbi:MAG: hypothetical protein CMF60_01700 [Magnetococcales bacterium]|nr:hypothetical protein [Magnetococcales bacterium]|tara:strand:- start:37191 stop:37385 length:195 start_codon:yes stop_codon:yes gene_type:complete